jgi:hypothetical protein
MRILFYAGSWKMEASKIVIHFLKTGVYSETCVIRWSCFFGNILECTYPKEEDCEVTLYHRPPYNLMGPLLYMCSVVIWNIVMQYITVYMTPGERSTFLLYKV